MAWLGKVSLGGFPDLARVVTKLSKSVKNIVKNFDSALGLEEKSNNSEGNATLRITLLILDCVYCAMFEPAASRIWPSVVDKKALFDPVMAFMGNREDELHNQGDSGTIEVSEKVKSS
ncbi:Golgin candidate 5 [Dendrobium catenatum]|uniref:Golgin candidate 5 n=1 Tax=Dendrobium catenatum TaxID=906689 RepID=A0A2I0X9D6_9ASPA|nr:Golgin candidate 5 [Dendrobium catenatum]